MANITPNSDGDSFVGADTAKQLSDIQKKLNDLKQRREELEEQRRRILGSSDQSSSRPRSLRGPTQNRRRHSQPSQRTLPLRPPRPPISDHSIRIPNEKERQQTAQRTPYLEMKESMRRSWSRDSSLVMGSFLMEDNPRARTFTRERRFIPPPECNGIYFLGTEMELMIRNKNVAPSQRSGRRDNTPYRWNDIIDGVTPGPGAYTPLFSKVSKPSRRAQLF
ncbi:hypothetical protein DPX39_040010300 [Trypanosoma brucei equiperdum]|uniref:Uncharacterized protein n=1 Tax=Trypanosoma brucei equiperdum TaxID=630700 RepID=A0A3L6L7U4_9TRYP|nr:hypothetical protein DPX39_040010300 [Trypanosoma brucei equiperdum]